MIWTLLFFMLGGALVAAVFVGIVKVIRGTAGGGSLIWDSAFLAGWSFILMYAISEAS